MSAGFCFGCGMARADGGLCDVCCDEMEAAAIERTSRQTATYCVVLKRVPFPGRWVKRNTLLAHDLTRDAARKLSHEYRATGWGVEVVRGAAPLDVYVPQTATKAA